MTDTLTRLQSALADRYDIERELGRGGMAVVFLARDLKHERKVALKVLRPELAATVGAERFLREIRIAAQLNHPHILPLLDSGRADGQADGRSDELLYYVMPFVEGESLRDKLARERELPIAEAIRILRDVVDALAMAHSRDVIHRDIKPDNVMLSGRHALVADFGVAKALSKSTGAQDVTTAGVALGTPAYMSPEQAVADELVDHRSDIYAVGALAYELLTGRPPFLGTSAQMVLSAHVADIPDPVTKYRDTVSPALEHLVLRCLEKKPADRWQSAEELLTQLEAIATPSGGLTPTAARPITSAAAQVRRGKRVFWGALGVAVLAAVVMGVSLLRSGSGISSDTDRVVVAVFRNETGDSSLDLLGRMAAHQITLGVQRTGAVEVMPWESSLGLWLNVLAEVDSGLVIDPLAAMAEEAGADIVISGTYYLEGGDIRIQADVNDASEESLLGSIEPVTGSRDSVTQIVERLQQQVMGFLALRYDERMAAVVDHSGDPPPYEAYQAFNEGLERYIGNSGGALQYFRQAVAFDSTFFEPLFYILVIHYNSQRFDRVDSVLDIMEGISEQLTPYYRAYLEGVRALARDRDHESSLIAIRRAAEMAPGSRAWYNYGVACLFANRPQESIYAFTQLDPERGITRGWTGYWWMLWQPMLMLGEYERMLEVGLQFGEHFPNRRGPLHVQALAYAGLGRVDELNVVLDELTGLSAPLTIRRAMNDAVLLLRARGDTAAARDVLIRSLEWFETRPQDESADNLNQAEYGLALYLAGMFEESQEVFDGLVERSEHPHSMNYRTRRGFTAAIRGDSTQAIEDAEWLAALDPSETRGWSALCLAQILGALGQREEAVRLLREAYEQGAMYTWYYHIDPAFDPLRGYPPFEEWLRPKG